MKESLHVRTFMV